MCDGNRTIQAVFMDSVDAPAAPTADTPPPPTGSVSLTLDSAPAVVLSQSMSADGARYGTEGDALVFWSKGAGALVLQNGTEGMYTNCMVVKDNTGGLSQVYHDATVGFTLRYPVAFLVTATYTYNGLGTKKGIAGVKFTIPAAVASGTNLSSDSYLSVEHLGTTTTECDASAFLLAGTHATATVMTEHDVTYSVASSSGAAAGNRYEEVVYALPGSQPCIAVRTFIHYGVFENYASGTVKVFDHVALEKGFAAIRDSLTFVPHIVPAE
jgi:membrane-bound inhibitor of C-type lysozyme